jgi:excisionase family DNA binding protein
VPEGRAPDHRTCLKESIPERLLLPGPVNRQYPRVVIRTHDLVTTGQAAILLRSSRAHVVDMCLRGLLPYVRVGGQRRIRRADIEAMIRPTLTREQQETLWLHRAVAGKVVANPSALMAAAAVNLRRLRRLHPEGRAWEWLDRWEAVLDEGVEAVLDALTSSAHHAVTLRSNSPFAGVLSETERRTVAAAFAASRRDHARQMRREQLEQVLGSV